MSDTSEAIPYSFGKSAHLTTEKSALYTEAAHQIASDMSEQLTDWLQGFTVEAGSLIEAEPGDELHDRVDDFDEATILGNLDTSGPERCGSVLTEFSLGLTLTAGLLGGSTMASGEPRPLTSIERRVLDLVSVNFVEVAARTLLIGQGGLNGNPLVIDRSRDGAFAASDDDAPSARVGFSFRIQGPGGSGLMILGIDVWALQKFSDTIDVRLSGRRAAIPTVVNPLTAAALGSVPIPFAVGLGRINLTAREVVGLQEGDVIRTRQSVDADVIASVDAVDLFIVRLGQRGQTLTAEILASIDSFGSIDRSTVRNVNR